MGREVFLVIFPAADGFLVDRLADVGVSGGANSFGAGVKIEHAIIPRQFEEIEQLALTHANGHQSCFFRLPGAFPIPGA